MEQGTEEVKNKAPFDTKKWLHSFKVKNHKGEEQTFFILKPLRSLRQLGEIEYAKQLAVFVKSGLLPKAAWNAILENLGGTVSVPEAEAYNGAKRRFFELSIEKNELEVKNSLTDDEKDRLIMLSQGIDEAKKDIQAFELEQIYVFENTAEAKARNATVQWWLTQLSYKGEREQFFQGKTVDEKLDWYDELDSSGENPKDSFLIQIGQRMNYLITLWFLGRISTWEDFAETDRAAEKPEATEETPALDNKPKEPPLE